MPVSAPDILVLNPNVINLLEKDLRKVGRELAGKNRLRQLFEKIRDEVVIPSIDENFVVGGRPRWDPISEQTYMKRKNKTGSFTEAGLAGLTNALMDTGQMHRAATAKARFTIRENEMRYGNWPEKRWFAVVHNVQAYASNAQIPWRPFSMFQPEDIQEIGRITMEWVEQTVERNMRRRYA